MTRWIVFSFVIVTSGCATPRAEKLSFQDVFGESEVASEPPRPARRAPQKQARTVTAGESMELQAELARFAHVAQMQRSLSPPAGGMPVDQQENWRRLLDAIDRFLARPISSTAPSDVIRARVALDAELEFDARKYGAFPADVGGRAMDRLTRLAIVMAALRRGGGTPAGVAEAQFDWPIEPVFVTSLYGRRVHPISGEVKAHFGIDLDAYTGQLVSAAGRGIVLRAGWNGAHGRQVELQHAGGVITRYSHLSAIVVEPGAIVERGDPIGLAGSSGLSTGTHLHFEFWRDGKPQDPLEALSEQSDRPAMAGTPRS